MIYTPEMDCGGKLAGVPCMSANLWLPINLVPNKQAILRAGTITVEDYNGNTVIYTLAQEVNGYLAIARHLFTNWEDFLDEWYEPAIEFEPYEFKDEITLRDGPQEVAWSAFDTAEYGILNLACGKGKTVLALKKIASRGFKALVIVNNTGLLDQWKEEAKSKLGLTEDEIGIVQGKKDQWDRPLVLAMIHTLGNRAADIPEDIKQKFGTIIWDEVHHLSAAKFLRTANVFYGARYGLSATPEREDGLEPIYYAHVGPIFYTDLTTEIPAEIRFKPLDTECDFKDDRVWKQITSRTGEIHMKKLSKWISNQPGRNKIIKNDVLRLLKENRRILVLTDVADHPEQLKQMCLADSNFAEYEIGAISGAVKGEYRTPIIRTSNVTFATYGVAKEGLDAPGLDTLLCITPYKAWGFLQQGKGRIERRADKQKPLVIIYEDQKIPPAFNMCRSLRRKISAKGFTYRRDEPPRHAFRKI